MNKKTVELITDRKHTTLQHMLLLTLNKVFYYNTKPFLFVNELLH